MVVFGKGNICFEEGGGKMYFGTQVWIEVIVLRLLVWRFVYWVIEI